MYCALTKLDLQITSIIYFRMSLLVTLALSASLCTNVVMVQSTVQILQTKFAKYSMKNCTKTKPRL